ncbi:3'-5' exonuclease [Hydrogenophaga sp.]|uniref:3'-5' exonuclease n=1 Tax=Hydrogenophaga sp. TaxID=1904254 RepID=UPI003D09AB4D
MNRIAVIDFETTGTSPGLGDRATEVAIVITEHGRVVDRYQSLMNAGVRIPAFITQLTGITNAMVEAAPPAERVMREAARFVGDVPMVAHNAAFDRRYWVAELARMGVDASQPFACTVLLSRRLYPQAPSHRLGSLVDFFRLPRTGQAHRALADAEMAAELLGRIQHDLRTLHGVDTPDHAFLMALQRCTRAALPRFMQAHAQAQRHPVPLALSARAA